MDKCITFRPAVVPVYPDQVIDYIKDIILKDDQLADNIKNQDHMIAAAIIIDNSVVINYYGYTAFSQVNKFVNGIKAYNTKHQESRCLIFDLRPNGHCPIYNIDQVGDYGVAVIEETLPVEFVKSRRYAVPNAIRTAEVETFDPTYLFELLSSTDNVMKMRVDW
jgi:hypothetical protein